MALTECSTDVSGLCNLELSCPIKSNQRVINQAVRGVLEKITLADLVQPLQLTSIKDCAGRLVPMIVHPGESNEFEYRHDSRTSAAGIQVGLRHRYRRRPRSPRA